MNKRVVVTRPNHDFTTRYLSYWAQKVIAAAERKGDQVLDLKQTRATRREFESVVEKLGPDFIFLNGHGNTQCVTGQDNELLVAVGENEVILRGTVVYALSCQAARKLGPAAGRAGTNAFIGYTGDFIFYRDTAKQTRPHHDSVARKFLEPSNQIPLSLLKGNTAQQAQVSGKGAFRKNIRKLLTSETSAQDTSLLSALVWDMTHLECIGDPASVI